MSAMLGILVVVVGVLCVVVTLSLNDVKEAIDRVGTILQDREKNGHDRTE